MAIIAQATPDNGLMPGATEGTPPPDTEAISFKRAAFIHEGGIGKSEIVTFNGEFVRNIEGFLSKQVVNLREAKANNPHLLDDPQFLAEQKILEVLDKGEGNDEATEQAISNFVRDRKGLTSTMLYLEKVAGDYAAAMALYGVREPEVAEARRFWIFGKKQVATGQNTTGLGSSQIVFDSIANDPARRAFFAKVYRIDIDHFIYNPSTGQVEQKANTISRDARRGEELLEDTRDMLDIREEFLNILKVPNDQIHGSAVEQILRNKKMPYSLSEKIALRVEERALDIFDRLGGFKPGKDAENYENRRKAESIALAESVMQYAVLIQSGEAQHKAVSSLEAKQTDFETKTKTERARLDEQRKQQLTEEQALAQGEQAALAKYQSEINALNNTYAEARKKTHLTGGNIKVADLDEEVARRERWFKDTREPGSYAEEEKRIKNERQGYITAEETPRLAGITDKDRQREIKQTIAQEAEERFKLEIGDAKRRLHFEEQKGQLDELQAIRMGIYNREKALEPNSIIAKNAEEALTTLQKDYDLVTDIDNELSANGLSAVVLGQGELLSLPLSEIMKRINVAHTAALGLRRTPAILIGWPESENNKQEYRKIIMRAKLEAEAQDRETHDRARTGARTTAYRNVTDPGAWDISDHELRTLDKTQIQKLLRDIKTRESSTPPFDRLPTIHQVELAIAEAQNKVKVRLEVMNEQTQTVEKQIQQLTDRINGISVEAEKRQLAITIAILKRQGKIINRASEIFSQPDRFTSINKLASTDTTHTQTEKNDSHPEAYYAWLDALCGYEKSTEEEKQANPKLADRASHYEEAKQVLDPTKMATLLNAEFNLGLSGANVTPENVFQKLNHRLKGSYKAKILPPPAIYVGLRNMLNTLAEEAAVL